MINKKQIAIVYLELNSFTYFTTDKSPMTFTYPSASVKEHEVINEELFMKEASDFLISNKIPAALLTFIIDPGLLYEKEIIENQQISTTDNKNNPQSAAVYTDSTTLQNAQALPDQAVSEVKILAADEKARLIQSFLDMVPVEEVASKIYKTEKGFKIVATNKKLYETVILTFIKMRFVIDAVLPYSVLPADYYNGNKISQETANKIFKKTEFLKQYSLLEENSYALSRAANETHGLDMTTKVSSKKDYALIAVFLLLLIILGALVYTNLRPKSVSKVASIESGPKINPTAIPTSVPTSTPSATSEAALSNSLYKIKINGGSNIQTQLLEKVLEENGYSNIAVDPAESTTGGKILVIFLSSFPQANRDTLVRLIRANTLSVSVQEVASAEADVIINL